MGITTKVAKLLMIGLIIAAVGYGTERSVSAAGKFAPPENLTASSAQAGVVLTWAAPSGIEGVTGYRIVRKRPDGEKYVQVVVSDTGSTNTTWTDTNVNDGVRYKYGVKGIKSDQLGKRTALVAIVYDQPVTQPEAPTDLSIESADDGLVLTWVKPASGDKPTGYQILRRVPDGNMSVYVSDTGSTSTTWTDTDVSDGVLYKYRTKSLNVAGTSRRSNQVEMQWEAPEETDDGNTPNRQTDDRDDDLDTTIQQHRPFDFGRCSNRWFRRGLRPGDGGLHHPIHSREWRRRKNTRMRAYRIRPATRGHDRRR